MNADKINDLYAGLIFSPETQKLARERIHWMCRQVQGDTVLDIGCSQGIVCLLLGREGFNCVGIDYEMKAIEFARNELQKEEELVRNRVRFELIDATSLPFENESFDTVILGEILEHMTHPGRILQEAKRVLKQGGVVVITVPFGLNASPDHKMTYYPSTFQETVLPYFETVTVETIETNILYCGRKTPAYDPATVNREVLLRDTLSLQKSLERRCLVKEQTLLQTTTELYKQINTLDDAVKFHKNATSEVQQLCDQNERHYKDLLEEKDNAVESAKAGAAEAVTEYAHKLAQLEQEKSDLAAKTCELERIAHDYGAALADKESELSALSCALADQQAKEQQRLLELSAGADALTELKTALAAEARSVVSLRERLAEDEIEQAELAAKMTALEALRNADSVILTGKEQEYSALVAAQNALETRAQTQLQRLEEVELESAELRAALETERQAVASHRELLAQKETESADLLAEKTRNFEVRERELTASLETLEQSLRTAGDEHAVALEMREKSFAETINYKETESALLLTEKDAELKSLRLKNVLDLNNKERYFRMVMREKEKEHAQALLKKMRGFEATLNGIEKRYQDDAKSKDCDLTSLMTAHAQSMDEMRNAYAMHLKQLREEWEVRLLEQGIEHQQAMAKKSAERNDHLSKYTRDLELKENEKAQVTNEITIQMKRQQEEWQARLQEIGLEHQQTLARKTAEMNDLIARQARETEERERALQDKLALLENEWQARLLAKDEELKAKLAEIRFEKDYALADQEKLFRHAYSWRLGSLVTGAVVLAANTAKKPMQVGKHLKEYISSVNPDSVPDRRIAGQPLPGVPQPPAAAASPESIPVHVTPLQADGVRKDKITLGCILDEFTTDNFRPECRMITFRPDNWQQVLEANPPHAIFVESAWRGNDGAWLYRVAQYQKNMGDELEHLLEWAKGKKIPSFFWNKEDPVHFDRFIPKAKSYDYIFTSDADCIPRYREALGHDRVFALPFAAQPLLQNPVLEQKRENLACFAGTYYGTTFPERQKDMEYLLRPALDFGLHIYDRQFGMVGPEAEKYRFPDIYQEAIKGRLDFTEMVKAYKRYRVFLNVNSVKDSPTMFSRRVFELLACGTPVISTYSKGIQEMFGNDLVLITESEADTKKHLEKLFTDEEYWARLSVRGMRHVMAGHTYAHRMRYILNCMGMNSAADDDVYFSALARVNSLRDLDSLQASLSHQNYRKFEVTLLYGDKVRKAQLQKFQSAIGPLKVILVPAASEHALEQAIAHAKTDYVCIFNPPDYYGPNYLKDYALALNYSHANYLGKESYYTEQSNRIELQNSGNEFQYSHEVPVATLAIKRIIIDLKYLHKLLANKTFRNKDRKILSLDRFNYLHNTNHEIPADAFAQSVDL